LPETAFPVTPCINDYAIFHWPELLPFTVAIYKEKATSFRNTLSLGEECDYFEPQNRFRNTPPGQLRKNKFPNFERNGTTSAPPTPPSPSLRPPFTMFASAGNSYHL
jgi:hypothetical protein